MADVNETRAGPDLVEGVPVGELTEGVPFLGHVGGKAVVLVRHGANVSAVGATCTHWHAPMVEGLVVDGTLRCPWHHACFRLETGAVVSGPALDPLPVYSVVLHGGRVCVVKKKGLPVPTEPSAEPVSVVIVGAGAAGATCAEALRTEGYRGSIALIGDEAPVDRPNLSKAYLTGKADAGWMPLRAADFYREHFITLTTDDPAVAFVPQDHTVRLRSGRTLGYGALVLATGAAPVKLNIEGADLPNVFYLRSLADADALIESAAGARRAIVIGASFIGLEVAASLRERGLDVTVVAPEAVPLQTVLGGEVGRHLQSVHEARGVNFRLGVKPVRIRAANVMLEDGSVLPSDIAVVGVGVRPRVVLAEEASLKVDNGIVVDKWLRTSAADVFAAGDVARYPLDGDLVRIEHWSVAMSQGRSVARTIVGRAAPYRTVPFFWSPHFDIVVAYVGYSPRWDAVEVYGDLAEGNATIAYREGGRIHAVATIGRNTVSLRVEAAMDRGDDAAVEKIVRE